jgi:hypothetical protein
MIAFRTLCMMTVAALPLATALAQESTTRFRLAGDKGNIQGCIAMDPAMTRVHTLVVKGDSAELTSAGGINDKLKLRQPNVYTGVFELGGTKLDIVADTSAKMLTITEKNKGCKWWAKPEA